MDRGSTKQKILDASLELFSVQGFEATSISQIANAVGIRKASLYSHFENKQAIFDEIIQRMFELDEKQANENHVPAKKYEDDKEAYQNTVLKDLCVFQIEQFIFWTENEFARLFRRMITIEQYRSKEMRKLYQEVICLGPVRYIEDLFKEMIKNRQLNEDADSLGPFNLAILFFAPLQLSVQLYDGGADSRELKENLRIITKDFVRKFMN